MNIEKGKFYRSRGGQKYGPMQPTGNETFPWTDHSVGVDIPNWTEKGALLDANDRHNEDLIEEWVDEPATEALALLTSTPETETFGPLDIKTEVLAEAGRIVNGARRSAYGTPEMNFERIARFWQVYFQNTERDVEITAKDVSPMMRLMKEARLCETPDHYDSFVDIIGYTLTGAEVNKVKSAK